MRGGRCAASFLLCCEQIFEQSEVLCLSEKYGMNEVYKNNCLNINLKYWDYTPLNYDELWDIIDRLKVFEEMEDTNENK